LQEKSCLPSDVEVPFFPREPALLVVLSGPAAAGKDSICDVLTQWYPTMHKVITVTTRPPRDGEENGKHYHFISREEFDAIEATDGFVEHATVYDNSYGVPRIEIEDPLNFGLDVIARVDVQGAATLKRLFPDALLIFISPGSIDETAARMRQRSLDTQEQQERRLELAASELAKAADFDYVVVNERDRLREAASEVAKIIAAEKKRRGAGLE
jgi:guanylate kinase